jgi:phosphoenolpyruvate carboxykinase (GTP)
LTLGAEATFAAEGVEGLLRYVPMSMRPVMPCGGTTFPARARPAGHVG